ncbi:hypothetical protein M885DRAFT_514672 [Pelagophyceae sp. CCMP2097]|nr:hypothetical protein M885DRAFT_514672 [Pelagophyceae sp. CCMP2097]
MDVDKDDAAFVLGRGGATKRKVARVSGAEIELDEKTLTVTVQGSKSQCSKAEDYINFIRQQRVGPVAIDATEVRDDFTAYPVPSDCIGFVMGRNGQTLRSMEEEWGVLMFFAKIDASKHSGEDTECLCIFGPLPARRGAELKTMSAVEHKHPGYCVSSKGDIKIFDRVKGDEDEGGWGVDTMPLSEENFSYALGSQGSTRKKLAAASGCIIEYVGRLACFSGYKKDRRRGKDYLRWLLEQRTGQSVVTDPKARDDITILKVPSKSVAYLTGYRGESLRGVERESSTFCFTDGDRNDHTKESENLLIFSYSRSAREHAAEIVEDRLASHKRIGEGGGRRDDRDRRDDDRGGGDRYGGGGGGDRFGGGGGGGGGGRDESCWDFQKGRCTRGAQCRFSHADPGGGGGGGGDRDRRDRSRERDSGRRGDRDRRERSRSRDRDRKKSSRRGRSESDDSDHDRRRRR